ncbi:MAG TPA: winged helix-turn-helix domain-containing protein [Candidatus Binataceae bacterium]|nr:winged helix-turn-helix domain-containing protein [Candidatus Binataceae bacterium]
MHFPDYEEMDEPLLCFILLNGGPDHAVQPNVVYEPLADFFGLTKEDKIKARADGYAGRQWHNRVQWARQRLVNQGYLVGSLRNVWRLSAAGVKRASLVADKYAALKR